MLRSNLCDFSDADIVVKGAITVTNPNGAKRNKNVLNGIKARVFFEKNIEKKHLCCHDKNYYYFWKSNIRVINLIAGSRNMIEVSKNMSFQKISSTMRVVFTKYRQFLSVFYCF